MVKTKIIKNKGWYQLVVDDVAINKAYDCTQKEPVVLAVMSNYFDSGCWSVEDFRLTKYSTPTKYFDGNDSSIYQVKSEDVKNRLIARLHTYREISRKEANYISWSTFDRAVFDGDNPTCVDKYGHEQDIIARFTYKGALDKINEIKEYWNSFEGSNLEDGKIENPHRQISEITLEVEEAVRQEKEKKRKPR